MPLPVFETDGFRIGKENRATECRTCCRLLMAKGAVEVSEELKRGFMPKMQTFIRLAEVYKDEENYRPCLRTSSGRRSRNTC